MSDLQLGPNQRWLPVSLPSDLPNADNPQDKMSMPRLRKLWYQDAANAAKENLLNKRKVEPFIPKTGDGKEIDPKEAWTWLHRKELGKLTTLGDFHRFLTKKSWRGGQRGQKVQELLTPTVLTAFRHDLALALSKENVGWKEKAAYLKAGGLLIAASPTERDVIGAFEKALGKESKIAPASLSKPKSLETSHSRFWLGAYFDQIDPEWATLGDAKSQEREAATQAIAIKAKRKGDITKEDRKTWTLSERSNLKKLTDWQEVTKFFDKTGKSGRDRGWKVQNLMTKDTRKALQHDMVVLVKEATHRQQTWQQLDTVQYTRYLLMAGVTPEMYEGITL